MLNDAGIRNFLIVVAGLLIMFVGIVVLAKSSRAQFSEVARISGNALIGTVLIAAGAGALLLVAFGQSIIETILPDGSVGEPETDGLGTLGGLASEYVVLLSAAMSELFDSAWWF